MPACVIISASSLMSCILTCITWLEISPVLLLEIMIVHSHFYFTLLLFIAGLVINVFFIIEQLMRCAHFSRIIVSKREIMSSEVY